MHFSYLILVIIHQLGCFIAVVKIIRLIGFTQDIYEIIYSDKKYTSNELLGKGNSASIHKRKLRFLAIEMLKFKRSFVPVLCKKMIPQNRQNRYELRNNVDFTLALVKTVHKGLEGLSNLVPKILEFLPVKTEQTKSLLEFKVKLKIGIHNVVHAVFAKYICSL